MIHVSLLYYFLKKWVYQTSFICFPYHKTKINKLKISPLIILFSGSWLFFIFFISVPNVAGGGWVILYPNSNPSPMQDDRFGCQVQVPAFFVNIACRGYEPLKLDITKTCWELHTVVFFFFFFKISTLK